MTSSFQVKDLSSTVRQTLQRPGAISALVSLGVHALLFATLPILVPYSTLTDETEPEIRQAVDVLELTPEEQARLPEFSTSQEFELPPLFQDPLSLPQTDLVPLPDQNTSPPPGGLFADPLLQSPLPPFDPGLFRPFPQPAPPIVVNPSPAQPQTSPSPSPQDEAKPDDESIVNPPRRRGEPLTNEDATPDTQEPSDVARNSEPNQTPETESPADAPPSPQPRSDEEIIARLREDVRARQERIILQRQLTFNRTDTDQDPDYNPGNSWSSWMASLEPFGISLTNVTLDDKFPKSTIEATFPPEACEFVQQEVTADIGVVVDPEGNPIGGLSVLRSSGYELFNNRGGEAVLSEQFENETGKNLPYIVTVIFPYDGNSCSGGDTTASQ